MYATPEDLEQAIGETVLLRLSDRDRQGESDPSVIANAIARASSTIDGYVAKRYKLPLTAVPTVLNDIAITLTHYILDLEPNEGLTKKADDARKTLLQISQGVVVLTDAELIASGNNPSQGGDSNLAQVEPFRTNLDTGGFEL